LKPFIKHKKESTECVSEWNQCALSELSTPVVTNETPISVRIPGRMKFYNKKFKRIKRMVIVLVATVLGIYVPYYSYRFVTHINPGVRKFFEADGKDSPAFWAWIQGILLLAVAGCVIALAGMVIYVIFSSVIKWIWED
jgi:hypothetical protein